MVRAIGALLVIGAAASWGILRAGRLAQRAKVLRELLHGLGILKSEICFRAAPMEQALLTAAESGRGPVRALLRSAASELTRQGRECFAAIWENAEEKHLPMLTARERRELAALGATLGRYDAPRQAEALDRAMSQLEIFAARAERERRDRGRLHVALGMAAGIVAVILLM